MANAVDPVVIEFALKGLPAVFRAFEQLSKVAAKAESEWARASTSSAQTRMRALLSETQQKARVAGRSASDAERALAREEKAAERAAKAKIREADKAAKEAVRIEARKAKEVDRILQKQRRDEKRLVDESMREAKQAAAARASIAKQEAAHDWQSARSVGRGLANTARRTMGIGMSVARGVMDVGGGFSVKDSVQRDVNARGSAATIVAGTQKIKTATSDNRGLTSDEVVRHASSVGSSYVMDRGEVIKGIGEFKDRTGDTRRGMRISEEMAKLANATGSDFAELMANAGEIATKNEKMSDSDVVKLARVQAAQGQAGAVELKDFARFGARTVSAASLFGGDRVENIGTSSALAQLAKKHGSASSAAEATMAALRFSTDLAKKGGVLKEKFGINVSDGKGTLRGQKAIIADLMKATGGDVTKIANAGIGERGNRVLEGAGALYREAGGGAAGQKAVADFFEMMTKQMSDAEVEAANKERLAEVDKQLEKAMNDLRQSVGEALLPSLQQLIPIVREVTPQFVALMTKVGELVSWASKNPFATMVSAMTVALVAEVGKANIATLIRSMVQGGGGGGGVPQLPGGGGGNSVVNALGAGTAAAAATAALYTPVAQAFGEQDGSKQRLLSGLQNGEITPEQAQAQVEKAKSRTGAMGVLKSALAVNMAGMSTAASLLTGKNESANTIRQVMGAKELVDSDAVAKAITRAIERGASAANASGPNPNRTQPINGRGGAP